MKRERWERIDDILDLALEAEPSQRDAIVAAECGDDAELAAEVRRFLAACEDGSDLFETPPHTAMSEAFSTPREPDRDALKVGEIVGHYRLVKKIGSGGMGAVYHAERADGDFEKRVALKVIKRGLDTDDVVERFHDERRILARLQHPNIAGLLDGGATEAGLPYFVMEYVFGEPIDQYVRRSVASLEDRIRLFLTVCEAVQYAHQNLIVHRDLKPSNVLVSQGKPKLLDFGIAKVLNPETGSSETGTQIAERRLTPQYAAPEQVLGQPVSTATDVYALGVILYELVAGRRPYEIPSRSLMDVERVVCGTQPEPPSVTAKAVRGAAPGDVTAPTWRVPPDLDAIILTALKKEPERRYGSVALFAEDLRRFLEGHPVHARPDTALYRISRFVRRNAALVGLGTAAVLTLSIGVVTISWQARVANRERDLKEQEARSATGALDFWVRTMGDLDPDRLGGQRTFTPADLIERGLANLEVLSREPEVRGPVMNTLAQVMFNLGDRSRADSVYREANMLLETIAPHPAQAVSLMGLGLAALRDLRFAEAVDSYRRALAIRQEVLSEGDPAIAESMTALGFALYTMGESAAAGSDTLLAEAEQLYLGALTSLTEPSLVRARALEGMGDLELARTERPLTAADSTSISILLADAEQHYREAIQTGVLAANDTTPDDARRLWGLSATLHARSRSAEAVDASRRALAVMERTYGEIHPDVALAYYYVGNYQYETGHFAAAATSLERSAEISARLLERSEEQDSVPDEQGSQRLFEQSAQRLYAGDALVKAGQARLDAGQPAQALTDFERSVPWYESAVQPSGVTASVARSRIARADCNRGRALTELGDRRTALTTFRAALASMNDAPSRSSNVCQSSAEVASLLADVFQLLQQPDSARFYRDRATELRRR